jgi:hemolysin activation/secretion protein
LDVKRYHLTSYNTNLFFTHSELPNPIAPTLPPVIVEDELASPQPVREQEVQYLPFSVRLDLSLPDRWGVTTLGLGVSANAGALSSGRDEFQALTGSTRTTGTYGILSGELSRVHKLPGDTSLLLRLGGQWATEPLISNEQFAVGGVNSVRGYKEGTVYGDDGWRIMFEPRSPLYDLGLVDSRWVMRGRFSVFTDYGEAYRIEDPLGVSPVRLWGTGCGLGLTIGEAVDMRVALAWPLLDVGSTKAGRGMVHFSVSAQF